MLLIASAGVLSAALNLTKIFPFAPPVSYFIDPSQNSLFPLQAVNLMQAAASLSYALHFLPSGL